MTSPATPDLTDPRSYRWFTDEHTRFSDTDAIGHVNNVSHVAIIETGRARYLLDLLQRVDMPFSSTMFVRLEVDFRDDLWWPTTVRVGARALAIGTSSFRVGVGVFDGDRCITTSVNVLVHLGEDTRPAPVPEALRTALQAEIDA